MTERVWVGCLGSKDGVSNADSFIYSGLDIVLKNNLNRFP